MCLGALAIVAPSHFSKSRIRIFPKKRNFIQIFINIIGDIAAEAAEAAAAAASGIHVVAVSSHVVVVDGSMPGSWPDAGVCLGVGKQPMRHMSRPWGGQKIQGMLLGGVPVEMESVAGSTAIHALGEESGESEESGKAMEAEARAVVEGQATAMNTLARIPKVQL